MITEKTITDIALSIFSSQSAIDTGRTTYLRTLIEATQDELAGKKGETKPVQLAALGVVHERFYALIIQAAQAFVPKTQKDRAIELHKRANFARTALGAVRNHIKAGEDIVALNAAKAVKRALKSPPRKATPLSVKRWKARAETQSKALVATLIGLADTDRAAAVEEMQLVLGQLTAQLVAMGVRATKDAVEAFDEHRPLRVGKTLFMPTDTQIVRQQARPS